MPRTADPLAKAKLLRAARAVFADAGLAAARIEDVAKAAGLAKGSFYLHFKSKEQAFEEICDAFFVDTARLIGEECCVDCAELKTGEALKARFREVDGRVLEFLWSNREVLKMIYTSVIPRYAHLLDAMLDAQAQQITENIRELQRSGVYVKRANAEVVGWLLTGCWHAIGRRMTQLDRKPDFAAWIESMHVLWLDGLLKR